jgi:lipopolysaccharide assembly protein A
MSFLRTLFWIVVAVIVALFCFNNWTRVSINLWNGLILDTKLPVLLFLAFLLGLMPTLILWQATRWRLRRRLQSSEPVIMTAPLAEPGLPAAPISTVPPGGA